MASNSFGRPVHIPTRLLELMTPPKPKTQDASGKSAGGIELMGKAAQPEDPLLAMISSYRRKLSMALN